MSESVDFLKRGLLTSVFALLIVFVLKKLTSSKQIGDKKVSSITPVKKSEDERVQDTTPFLNKDEEKPITLISRIDLSSDSAVLRFALDKPNRVLGLPVGKHFKLIMPNIAGIEAGKWNGKEDAENGKEILTRSYTPTSGDENLGVVDLLVKFYLPGAKPQFPDGGKVSRQLEKLKVGDKIKIQGPFGRIEYKGKGVFKIGSKEQIVSEVGMMAGGSGITPMLQILRYALADKTDSTKFSLIYANQTEEDILVREELEKYSSTYPTKFHLHYTLDRPKPEWGYSTGFISEEMIRQHLPPPSDKVLMLMCGPPPMVKFACRANMEKIGYDKACQIEF